MKPRNSYWVWLSDYHFLWAGSSPLLRFNLRLISKDLQMKSEILLKIGPWKCWLYIVMTSGDADNILWMVDADIAIINANRLFCKIQWSYNSTILQNENYKICWFGMYLHKSCLRYKYQILLLQLYYEKVEQWSYSLNKAVADTTP